MQFLMLRIACAFTNYVSSAAENSYPIQNRQTMGQWTWEQKNQKREHMPNGKIIVAYQ